MRHYSHSPPSFSGEARTGIISKLEIEQGTATTHKLESQMTDRISRLQMQQGIVATHKLENQEQALSAGLTHCKAL